VNNGKICVSVCAETADEMIANIKRAEEFADVIEVRFDCLRMEELEPLLPKSYRRPKNVIVESATKPIISTFRPKEQGGCRDLSLNERNDFWNSGNETDYCDVEEEFVKDSSSWLWGERICSYHDFSGVPQNINEIFDRLAKTDAETIKVAVQTDDITDAVPVWALLEYAKLYKQRSRPKIIPIAMGEAGKWTRILGLAHGAFMTYASLDAGMETADGQITAKDLIETYRVKELDLNTKVYGVIGDPVSESLSPYMHNPAFVEQSINAVFIPLEVRDLSAFVRRMVRPETREVELNFAGFAVTMPHKQEIIKYLDVIDPIAEKIGAVNTVRIDDGKLTGYNTDAYGFITPLKAKLGDLKGARIAVFGAGGVARSCVFALKQENADVTVFARDRKKGEGIAGEFDAEFKPLTTDHRRLTTDILVNATPLGMKGPFENESLFTAEQLEGVKFVYDLVTNRNGTPLIREAKKARIPAIGGLEMLIHQGAKQFEIWTGQAAPIDKMRTAILDRIQK